MLSTELHTSEDLAAAGWQTGGAGGGAAKFLAETAPKVLEF